MVQINFALKEVNCKIVYYGPGMSGKTTNLEIVHQKAPTQNRGELTSIATEGDRTLFFDFMPLDLGNIAGMRTKFQLYTVPGQVYYNSTRKLVLQGVDGIIFVADSQEGKMAENLESMENLRNNLAEYGKRLEDIPMVIQYNKRDLPDIADVAELNEKLNPRGLPWFEAVAVTGEGVFPTLKALSGMVLQNLSREKRPGGGRRPPAPRPPAREPSPAPRREPAPAAGPMPSTRPAPATGPAPAVAPAPAREPTPAVRRPAARRAEAPGGTPPAVEPGPRPRPSPRPEPAPLSRDRPAPRPAPAAERSPGGIPVRSISDEAFGPAPGTAAPAARPVPSPGEAGTRVRMGTEGFHTRPPATEEDSTPERLPSLEERTPTRSAVPAAAPAASLAREPYPGADGRGSPRVRTPVASPRIQRYIIEEESGSPLILVVLIAIILAAVGVILYSFNMF